MESSRSAAPEVKIVTDKWTQIQQAIWLCDRCKGDSRVEIHLRQQTDANAVPCQIKLLVAATAPPYESGVYSKKRALSVNNKDERQHQNPPQRVVGKCVQPHFAEEFRLLRPPVAVTLGIAARLAVRKTPGVETPSFLNLPLKEFGDDDVFTISFEGRPFNLIVSSHPNADSERARRDIRRGAIRAGVI